MEIPQNFEGFFPITKLSQIEGTGTLYQSLEEQNIAVFGTWGYSAQPATSLNIALNRDVFKGWLGGKHSGAPQQVLKR